MTDIIPAIIPQNLGVVRDKLEAVRGAVTHIQIDIVDGKYANTKTWPFMSDSQADELTKIARGEERFPLVDEFKFEIDMLVLHPIEYLSDFIALGATSFVIHVDSTDHIKQCIEAVKNSNREIGLGIRPSVDVDLLQPFLPDVDFVQFMGNDRVGHSGVEIDQSVINKIKYFHDHHPSVPIQVDIGLS